MTATLFFAFTTALLYLIFRLVKAPNKRKSLAYLTGFLVLSYVFGPYISNQGSLIENEYYVIPVQSSILTFRPTVYDQEGSGDNWIYAQDFTYYYYSGAGIASERLLYIYISRAEAKNCKDFEPTEFNSWCIIHAQEHDGPEL